MKRSEYIYQLSAHFQRIWEKYKGICRKKSSSTSFYFTTFQVKDMPKYTKVRALNFRMSRQSPNCSARGS